jgi:hypothetical protein
MLSGVASLTINAFVLHILCGPYKIEDNLSLGNLCTNVFGAGGERRRTRRDALGLGHTDGQIGGSSERIYIPLSSVSLHRSFPGGNAFL